MRIERIFGTVAVLPLFAACNGGDEPKPVDPETITSTVTITETNQVTVTNPKPPGPCDRGDSGVICTYVGTAGLAQFSPEGLDRLSSALYLPVDSLHGPDGTPYVLDWNNHRIRQVNPDDSVTTAAGTGFLGDGIFNADLGIWEDGPAGEFAFNHPTNLAFDPNDDGHLYVAAWHNSRVERLNLATGEMEFYAGSGARSFAGDGGQALGDPDGPTGPLPAAALDLPSAIAFDDAGVMYISDQANQVIRKVQDGIITTIAGTVKITGYAGDGGPMTAAKFFGSTGQAADPSSRIVFHEGSLYLADTENHVIRRIDLTTETVSTVVGAYEPDLVGIDTTGDGVSDIFPGIPGYAGDGAAATSAKLNKPRDIAFGADGEMYIADTGNHCIRVVGTDGVISTFAGQCGVSGFAGNNKAPTEALLNTPFGIEVDVAGNLFISDTYNHIIRVIRK